MRRRRVQINNRTAWIPVPASYRDLVTAAGMDPGTQPQVHFRVWPAEVDEQHPGPASGAISSGAMISIPVGARAHFWIGQPA